MYFFGECDGVLHILFGDHTITSSTDVLPRRGQWILFIIDVVTDTLHLRRSFLMSIISQKYSVAIVQ